MVLWPLPCEFCRVWASTSKVINEISVKFAWVFRYIYSFRRQFRRQFSTVFHVIFAGTIGWNYGNCPVNLTEFDWVLLKLLMQNTEPTLWQRRWSVFRWYLSQFSTVLHVILHTPFAAVAATALKNLVRFDRVFQKLLMWCTETTLFPRRQSAENAGRHWNSTEEVPSPHRTCVTEQLELTRQVARIERVIINTTST